jgi:pimeloyl-ACP methyl ester carboxylesterase
MVAMAHAIRYPDSPGKLILCSTSARPQIDRILSIFERLGGAEARKAAYYYLVNPNGETVQEYNRICRPLITRSSAMVVWDAWNRIVWRENMVAFRSEIRNLNLLSELSRIRCATLVLAGVNDPLMPIEDAEDFVAALPANLGSIERFANSGHGRFRHEPAFGWCGNSCCGPPSRWLKTIPL